MRLAIQQLIPNLLEGTSIIIVTLIFQKTVGQNVSINLLSTYLPLLCTNDLQEVFMILLVLTVRPILYLRFICTVTAC